MNTAATINDRKEIVAVLITLNNKIEQIEKTGSLYSNTQLAIFMSLRNYYLQCLLATNKAIPATDIAA